MDDNDLIFALQLQEEFDNENAAFLESNDEPIGKSALETANGSSWSHHSDSRTSVVDPSLEITDPIPDVRALFLQFNDEYFWGRLAGVEVRWSPRMTLCAGVCHYEGRGGLCSIRLSVPLLKLRPRKDLVETLLHEMIHAFLFVADNDREREEHGPNFKKHMHRINKASGANITIYHSFHDEVDNYRQHWWRCGGPCRSRPPYYGMVKRSMNRAPSANDNWWEDHSRSCGGTYTKVKEPEGYGAKKNNSKELKKDKEEVKGKTKDICTFFGKGQALGGSTQNNAGSTSGAKKKVISTASASGSSSPTVPRATNGSHTNNRLPNGENTDDFSLDSDWGGGIWAEEFSNISKPSSGKHSQNVPSTNQQRNWTVAETKKDKEIKLNSVSAESQTFDDTGKVLGQGSGEGESWLAKMRKQWVQETKTSSKSTSASHSDQKHTGERTQQVDSLGKKTVRTKDKLESERKVIKMECDGQEINEWLSDDSHHSSFHISSCEEDNLPTPEHYRAKHKRPKVSPKKEPGRKRTVIDLVSSGKDDFDFPGFSKRAKSTTKASPEEADKQHSLNLNKVRQQTNVKIPSEDRGNPQGSKTTETGASMSSSGAETSHGSGASTGRADDPVSLVSCPVCQTEVPSDDINRHLDRCLS
ncbi:hypothetical protein ACOMHN_026952 [Nucella lapillus]